jgi:hypothetical protein
VAHSLAGSFRCDVPAGLVFKSLNFRSQREDQRLGSHEGVPQFAA